MRRLRLLTLLGSVGAAGCSGGSAPATTEALNASPSSVDSVTLDTDGAANGPSAVIPTGSLDFGPTDCGSVSAPTTITIQNVGGEPLIVGASAGGQVFAVSPTTVTVSPGGSASLSVTAQVPASVVAGRTLSGALHITTNDPANRHTDVPLSATAQGATLAYPSGARDQVDFGSVVPNTSGQAALVLQNVGNATATFAFGAPSNALFSLNTSTSGGQLTAASGADVTQSLLFAPTANGFQRATMGVTVSSGAVCGRSVSVVKMSGLGSANAFSGWPTSYDLVGPGIDFGPVSCGQSGGTSSFTLTNSGRKNVTITGVAFSGTAGYSVDLTTGTVVPAGGSVQVDVTAPTVPYPSDPSATYGATLTITTDAKGDAPHALALNEEPYGAVLAVDTSATPDFGTFASTAVGSTASQSFQIVNTGTNANVYVTATSPFDTSPEYIPVPAGTTTPQSIADSLLFEPVVVGTTTGTLSFSADAYCQPLPAPIALSGTGFSAGLYAYPSSLALSETCGTGTPQDFTLTNYASTSVTWSITASGAFSPTASPTGGTLGPGASQAISVTPSGSIVVSGGIYDSTLTVANSSPGGSSTTVSVTTTGNGLVVKPTPQNVDFGNVTVGQSETVLVPFTGAPTEFQSFAPVILESGGPPFSLTSPLPDYFNGSATGWGVIFTPTAPGTATTTLIFAPGPGADGAPVCPPNTVTATGVGVEPG